MPDALAIAAERLAPSRAGTNYLDPAAGQSVISRYANAGRLLKDTAVAAEATGEYARARDDRMARQRSRIELDREDADYKDRQDFKSQRGTFLESIAAIDPAADDFEDQVSTLYKTLPPTALEDDAVSALLSAKRQTADGLAASREKEQFRKDAFEERKELMRMRYSNDPRLSVLSQEERNRFVGEDGEFDFVGAGQAAYEKARSNKAADVEVTQNNRLELRALKDLSDTEKAKRKLVQESLADQGAFGSQVEALRGELSAGKTPLSDADLREKAADRFAKAREFDSRQLDSELESARDSETADEYVAKGGSALTPEQKTKRKALWDEAQTAFGDGQPAAAKPAPADTGAPPVGFKSKGYVFTGGNPADKANWKKE